GSVLAGGAWWARPAAPMAWSAAGSAVSGAALLVDHHRLVARLIDAVAPYAVTPADLAAGALAAALVAVGIVAGRHLDKAPSWITTGPALALGGGHLVLSLFDTGDSWRAVTALVVGVGAIALGALRRLSTPLLGGTVVLGATVTIAAADELARLPVWAWLAGGGTLLVGIAVALEHRIGGTRETPGRTVLDAIRTDFR
ncbi:MAG: hypothetical protein OEY23_15280, partial [Acidimicrobiia bacterium]|nr:hypothetical protein [Acidimicrobiia bacterium]